MITPLSKKPCYKTCLSGRQETFTDLMNRALDKPADHVKLAGEEEPVELIVSWAGGYAAQSPGSSSTDGEEDRHRENIKWQG